MTQSALIRGIWSAFSSRAEPLKSFALAALKERNESEARAREVRALFDSIDTSITYASLYPHELLMFHLMSQRSFEIRVLRGIPPFDSGDIMSYIFRAQIPPLLPYVDNHLTLNQYQLLHAFDIAVRSGLFPAAGVDVDYFVSDTLRRMNARTINMIATTFENINQRFAATNHYREFKNACAEFARPARLSPRQIHFADLIRSPYYGRLLDVVWNGINSPVLTTSTPGQPSTSSMGLQYFEHVYAEAVEAARVDLGNSLRLAEAMLFSHSSHLRRAGASESAIAAKTQKTHALISSLKALREKVLNDSAAWREDIGSCYWQAAVRNGQVQSQLIEMEKAHLRAVYRRITRLRDPNLDAAEKERLRHSIRFHGLPSGYSGRDALTPDGYEYTQTDLLLRLRQYMMSGLTTEFESFRPVAPHLEILTGLQLNNDVEIVRQGFRTFLPFSGSEEEFVSTGLRTIFSLQNPYLKWLSNSALEGVIHWSPEIKSLASLYRMEHEMRGEARAVTPSDILGVHEKVLGFTSFTPAERELYGLLRVPSKIQPIYFEHRMVNLVEGDWNKVTSVLGIYDFPAKVMDAEAIGGDYDRTESSEAQRPGIGSRQNYVLTGRAYFMARARSIRGTSIIAFNSELDAHLDTSVGNFVRSELAAIDKFHRALTRRLTAPSTPVFDFNLFLSRREPLLSDSVSSNRAV
ncbi:MAG: hypothetical protein HC902_11495 [Calothrix sp. SM1_5_4]|nr:hypothetical protein [Calothrix sp. SM1_5_4]